MLIAFKVLLFLSFLEILECSKVLPFVTKSPQKKENISQGSESLDLNTRYGLRYKPPNRRLDVISEDNGEFANFEENEIYSENRVTSSLNQVFSYILARLGSLFRRYQATEAKGFANKPGRRFLNLFNIVRFPNEPCATSNKSLRQLNGTCYHQLECEQLGGVGIENCANGFGVCCICKYPEISRISGNIKFCFSSSIRLWWKN